MKSASRGPEIDTRTCVDAVGGNKYDLVLVAAARARELARQHRDSYESTSLHAPVSALLDIQAGTVGREYRLKIRK